MASNIMMFIPNFIKISLFGGMLSMVKQPGGRNARTDDGRLFFLTKKKAAYTKLIAEYSAFSSACTDFSNSQLFPINFAAISM
jgi:hypothetical protein